MSFFWDNVFEYVKERRRGAIFFCSLGLIIVGLLLGSAFANAGQVEMMLAAGTGLTLMFILLNGLRRLRAWRLNRYKSSPLSRDELIKARSKLMKR